jgi:uracil-DNA glycosylase
VRSLGELETEALVCTRCALAAGRTKVVFGAGDPAARVMFVGEGPGREEDLTGVPFVGRSGALLDRLMAEELGLVRQQCYIANVVKCRPPNNRDPLPAEVQACSEYLSGQVEVINPRVVITLGNFATRSLLGRPGGITSLRGKLWPFRGGVLVPTFHPAAALRGGAGVLASMRSDFVRARQALEEAS